MKKYLLIVTVFTLGLSLAACSGKKAENANASDDATKQEQVTPATNPGNDDVLTNYETLVNKVIDLQGKVASGDTTSADELAQVKQNLDSIATVVQNAVANFTPEQTQKYQDLVQKLAAAATPDTQK